MTEWMSDESGTVMVPGYEWARLHDEMMSLQVENERLEERNAALEKRSTSSRNLNIVVASERMTDEEFEGYLLDQPQLGIPRWSPLVVEARRARAAEAELQEEYSHQALLVTALREEMEQQEGELLRLRAVERTAEAFTAVWFGNKAVADEWAAYLAACTAYREWQKQEVEK